MQEEQTGALIDESRGAGEVVFSLARISEIFSVKKVAKDWAMESVEMDRGRGLDTSR